MKYLLTGANGQLAKEFMKKLESVDLFAFPREKLDISKEEELKETIDYLKPSVIINCAAYNNVDGAEKDYERARSINATAVKNIANFSSKYKTFIIHFSTDYVFGGKTDFIPYKETDRTEPLNKYGVTKLEGEKLLKENYDRFLIFRVSWLYGDGQQNFIFKLKNWSGDRKILKISTDEISIPSPTKLISEISLKAIKNDLRGLFHLVPDGFASRYEWAVNTMKFINPSIKIEPAKQQDFNLPAKRPSFSALDNSLIKKELSLNIKNWKEYLEEYLRSIK